MKPCSWRRQYAMTQKYLREIAHGQWSQGCNDVFNRVADEVGVDVGLDDLLLPICTSSSNAEQFRLKGKLGKIHASVCLKNSWF